MREELLSVRHEKSSLHTKLTELRSALKTSLQQSKVGMTCSTDYWCGARLVVGLDTLQVGTSTLSLVDYRVVVKWEGVVGREEGRGERWKGETSGEIDVRGGGGE